MTVTLDTSTDTDSPAGPAGPAGPDLLPGVDTPATPPGTAPASAPAAGPAPEQGRPGDRSDVELLVVLDREIERTGTRPTRKDVMALTGAGTVRATRLLTALDERHGWTGAAPPRKRGTAQRGANRTGTAPRSGTRPAPAPGTGPTPGPDTSPVDAGTGQPAPVTATPTPAPPSVPVPVPDVGADGGGRLVAWIGFVFGSVTSVAANVLAARIPPLHAPVHWSPSLTAEFGAAVWPLALLLSVEVLSRVRMPSGWYWKLAKAGGSVAVAGGSAVISYGHIHDVLATWNYSGPGAGVGPLVIDGLMVISGFALLALSRRPAAGTDPGTGTGIADPVVRP